MAGTLNVDTLKADSNLKLQIASANVAFIDASGLNLVGSNLRFGGVTVTSSQFNANGTILATGIASVNASTVTLGTLPAGRLPSGSVLQVVQGTSTAYAFSTTSTYADTGLTATITPSSSSSKILILIYSGQIGKSANDAQADFQIVKNGSSIFTASALNQGAVAALAGNLTINYLDSPATTSALTYKLQFRNRDTGTIYSCVNSTATIILMEIAG
jgi:hypothetical protein